MLERPSFYLGSKEHRGEWQRPRAAYVIATASDKRGIQHLWLRIDPPVIRQGAQGETKEIVIGPHFEGDVLSPQPRFPTAVYVYAPKGDKQTRQTVFDEADFDLVAWGEIYERLSDAAEGAPI